MEEGDVNILLSWDKETNIQFCDPNHKELISFENWLTTRTNIFTENNIDLEQNLSVAYD